jgi:hypothetical protein
MHSFQMLALMAGGSRRYRVITSEQVNEIAAALSKAQGEMKPASKDATNPHFKSKYADLAANVEAARGPLAKHGLSVVQEATTAERGIAVATRLLHSSGQWIQFDPLTVPLAKADAHGVGSATTYARRYALGAALGLVAEDDDGNAAVVAEPKAQTAVPMPNGYGEWWARLSETADRGTAALQAAWRAAPAENRDYTTARLNDKWEALKKKASEAKKPQPEAVAQ